MAEERQVNEARERAILAVDRGGIPKAFRVWDMLHERWFQGSTTEQALLFQTDSVHYFGEFLTMEGTLFDQNEDDAWKKSAEKGDVKGSLDKIEHLVVVQDTGVVDCTGRHIFEGDILELGQTRGYVLYNRQTGSYALAGELVTIYCDLRDCRIVGNIFENYNLLENTYAKD